MPSAAAASAAAMPIVSETRPPSQQPQQHVAAEFVGAERMRGRRPGEAVEQIDRGRVERRAIAPISGPANDAAAIAASSSQRQPHR